MKNIKFSRLFAAALLVACFAFAGCKPQVEEVTVEKVVIVRPLDVDDAIVATWANSGEKFEIQTNNFRNIGYDYWTDPDNPEWKEGYTGNNLWIRYTSETSGYIYMKYTKAIMPDWSYSTSAPDVGKWYALSFTNMDNSVTPNKIKIAGAYKENDGETSTDTLEEAIDTFTIEKGYFGRYSDLVKE